MVKRGGSVTAHSQLLIPEIGFSFHSVSPTRSLPYGGGEEMMDVFIKEVRKLYFGFQKLPAPKPLSCNKSLSPFLAAYLTFFS